MSVRLLHLWSSGLAFPGILPFCAPLVRRGWDVTHSSPRSPRVAAVEAHGMRWIEHRLSRRIDPIGDARGSVELWRLLRRERFDIVHTHNVKTGLLGRVLAALAGTPVVVHTLHGLAYGRETPALERTIHAGLETLANLGVDAILAQSQEDADNLLATSRVAPGRLFTIGNGIDLRRFSLEALPAGARTAARAELGVGEGEVLFLSAGRLVREKGFPELIEAAVAARLRDGRVRLALAGPRDDARADVLTAEALDRARAAGVLVLGERTDMQRLYAASDVVALASHREGLPRVLMEGAAMGKPLLATDVRGCREVVRPPRNGMLVPPRDPAALCSAMLRLAADAEQRQEWSRANVIEARERYDLDHVVTRVVAIYDALLATRGRSTGPRK